MIISVSRTTPNDAHGARTRPKPSWPALGPAATLSKPVVTKVAKLAMVRANWVTRAMMWTVNQSLSILKNVTTAVCFRR